METKGGKMKTAKKSTSLVFAIVLLLGTMTGQSIGKSTVKVWQEPLVLKSYIVEKPDPNPRFYEGTGHQGVQRHAYPYPMSDVLTDDFEDKSYQTFYLENEYIKISVIPNMGARIFSAKDKTNNYDFIYRQGVFKPSLIGMVGAWISGANAWGFPHHHGPLTIAPFEYSLKENPDGSKTIWQSKTDLRHRVRMLLGITIYPGKSYIEVSAVLNNCTPIVNSMLFWANPSVHADPTYQICFGPSVEYVTTHHKVRFARWPIADNRYGSTDYSGVDISWWKNVKRPVSFFSWDCEDDYFCGYSHSQQAGTAYVGNHHILPGMKVWEHGSNPEGNMWENMLTDTSGHYIELMAGAYTDNQPDYSWMQPYEIKTFKQYWFPIRELEGLKFANINGAANLELMESNMAKIRLNTTSKHTGARVALESDGNKLFEKIIDISPAQPFAANVEIPENIKETNLCLTLFSSQGQPLLSYKPTEKPGKPMPETVVPPGDPKNYKTVEQLYLAGLRLDQFYNARLNPYPYYEEALRRDPGNYNVNTQLGILHCKAKEWELAEERLQTAVDRVTYNYTRPKDGEALYYLGVALRAQGKTKSAYDAFYKATWSAGWHSAAYYQLAELDCKNADFARALEHLDRAVSTNANNVKIQNLNAIVLRKLDRPGLAQHQALSAAEKDLLDFQSRNELYLLKLLNGQKNEADRILSELTKIMRDDAECYLELSVAYGNCGFYDEAIDILSRLDVSQQKTGSQYPMVYYYLGYYWSKREENDKAVRYYRLAGRMPPDYCFPYRDESIDVLKHAQKSNPGGWRAPYYLGNLLYDHQPGNAIKEWEKARTLNDGFYILHRNLAWGYDGHEKNTAKAIASLEKAIDCYDKDARVFYELDLLYENAKVSPQKRLDVLEKNTDAVVKRDDSLARMVLLYVQLGRLEKAIEILKTNHFNRWEGTRFVRSLYEYAFHMKGIRQFNAGEYEKALRDFEAAFEYPKNLDEGKPLHNPRFAQTFYLIGTGHEALGNSRKAKEYFNRSAATGAANSEYLYYQGLAYQKLGQLEEAQKTFDNLMEFARLDTQEIYYAQFAKRSKSQEEKAARRHYLLGLAYLGRGETKKARTEFTKSVELNPNDLWANFILNEPFPCVP